MSFKPFKVGDIAPTVIFRQRKGDVTPGAEGCGFDGEWIVENTADMFNGKKVVIFSLPGAFTPTCTTAMVPDYEDAYEEMKSLGVDEVYCISVNDAFVMNAWADCMNLKNIKVIPDGNGEFTHDVGMLVSKANLGFGFRSWRYSAVIEDGKFTFAGIEPYDTSNDFSRNDVEEDPYGESAPQKVLEFLRG